MSNPIYEELKRADKVNDITEIDNIVEVYIQSNGKYLDLDKARKKIQELQKKGRNHFCNDRTQTRYAKHTVGMHHRNTAISRTDQYQGLFNRRFGK